MCWGKNSSVVVRYLEKGFYKWGRFVSRRPWLVIIASLLLTVVSSLSFINFDYPFRSDPDMKLLTLNFVSDPNKIWIPKGSEYLENKEWLSENFPQDKRVQTLIFKTTNLNGNILSPESLKLMFKVHKLISDLTAKDTSFKDICQR